MTTNLTLITTIVLTAAMTGAGTYYVVTNQQPDQKPVEEAAATQPSAPQPAPVAVAGNQQPNKPVEITIKTEVVEKSSNGRHPDHLAEWKALHSRPQPHYEVLK